MSITLKQIWESSTGLLQRFDLMPSFRKAYLKFQEEHFELVESLFKFISNKRNIPYRQDAAAELADCIVTLLNLGYAAGLTEDDIESALRKVCTKNDSKSHATHTAEDGWIKRKPAETIAYIEAGE